MRLAGTRPTTQPPNHPTAPRRAGQRADRPADPAADRRGAPVRGRPAADGRARGRCHSRAECGAVPRLCGDAQPRLPGSEPAILRSPGARRLRHARRPAVRDGAGEALRRPARGPADAASTRRAVAGRVPPAGRQGGNRQRPRVGLRGRPAAARAAGPGGRDDFGGGRVEGDALRDDRAVPGGIPPARTGRPAGAGRAGTYLAPREHTGESRGGTRVKDLAHPEGPAVDPRPASCPPCVHGGLTDHVQCRSVVCRTPAGSYPTPATNSFTSSTVSAACSDSANIFRWCSFADPAYVSTRCRNVAASAGRSRSRTKIVPPGMTTRAISANTVRGSGMWWTMLFDITAGKEWSSNGIRLASTRCRKTRSSTAA